MQRVRSIYSLINILSIDIAVGALCCALFFSDILNVHIRIYGLIALGLTVWIIYTADHLRDAKVIGRNASSPRHRFHFKYRTLLLPCLCVAVVADGVVILFMRTAVFYFGIYLALLVALYLVAQKYLKILKEVFIALLYTGGILLPSISVTSVQLGLGHYLLFLQLTIVAWVNLVIFSWFDYEQDVVEKQHSFVTAMGKNAASVWLLTMSGAHVAIFICHLILNALIIPAFVLFFMNVVMFTIFKAYRGHDKELFRWAGDAVFFIPGLFWLWLQL
jgi:hypothetical protein